jgi:hypothetical protein
VTAFPLLFHSIFIVLSKIILHTYEDENLLGIIIWNSKVLLYFIFSLLSKNEVNERDYFCDFKSKKFDISQKNQSYYESKSISTYSILLSFRVIEPNLVDGGRRFLSFLLRHFVKVRFLISRAKMLIHH